MQELQSGRSELEGCWDDRAQAYQERYLIRCPKGHQAIEQTWRQRTRLLLSAFRYRALSFA